MDHATGDPVILLAAVYDQIRAHANAAYPVEAIGLLGAAASDRRIAAAVPMANSARRPGARAIVLGSELSSASERLAAAGWHQVGVYHSHPDATAQLSRQDRRPARAVSVEIIVSVGPAGASAVRAWLVGPSDQPRRLDLVVDPTATE